MQLQVLRRSEAGAGIAETFAVEAIQRIERLIDGNLVWRKTISHLALAQQAVAGVVPALAEVLALAFEKGLEALRQ